MKLFLPPRYLHVVHRIVLPYLVEAGRSRVPGILGVCPGLYRDCFNHARNDEGSGVVVPYILNPLAPELFFFNFSTLCT